MSARKKHIDWPVRRKGLKIRISEISLPVIAILVLVCMYIFMIKPSVNRLETLHEDYVRREARLDSIRGEPCVLQRGADGTLAFDPSLVRRLQILEEQQSDWLADLRQENNNYLEYVNTWLGVWIAILALACGVAPAVLQYRLYIINRNKLREELEEYEAVIQTHKTGIYANGLSVITDSQIISDSECTINLIQILVRKAIYSFEGLIEQVSLDENKLLSPTLQENILLSLIHISSLLDRLRTRVSDSNSRDLGRITHKISELIRKMTGELYASTDIQTLHFELIKLLRAIQQIPVVWNIRS